MQVQWLERNLDVLTVLRFRGKDKDLYCALLTFRGPYFDFEPIDFIALRKVVFVALHLQMRQAANVGVLDLLYPVNLRQVVLDVQDINVLFALHYHG